ncbi:YnhF family membrane protein [Shimwellia pseudoproteus]|nr:YnhF family membrane protein [Shimwellia pseudoproteus]
MSTELRYSLITTVVALSLIVAASFTAILH